MTNPELVYPFNTPPAPGQACEVVPGLWWIRLPMPFSLDHVNVWALDDGDGWAIVDTGLHLPATVDVWRELLAGVLGGRPITRVLVTHMHPDHLGMAGWLTTHFGCRLWITRLEYLNARMLIGDTGREAPRDGVNFYRRAGWSDAAIDSYRARFGNFGRRIYALPDSYRRLHDGETFKIGAHQWRVMVGSGHSPEHACLYCEELQLLISGDQVLPKISSNVSVFPTEPDADPLAEWLASLAKIKRTVPDKVLVLPAHHDCFRGLHARLDALKQGHQRKLDRLRAVLCEPKRAVDVFVDLFGRDLTDADQIQMATGESVAHLNYLVGQGEVRKEATAASGTTYRRTDA